MSQKIIFLDGCQIPANQITEIKIDMKLYVVSLRTSEGIGHFFQSSADQLPNDITKLANSIKNSR